MIRGMSTNHSLILVDGKRYAGEDTDVTTNVYALERLDLSDIDRIEIVRGPSSSLYGSDAMGGVINIITKVPDKAGGTAGVVTGTKYGVIRQCRLWQAPWLVDVLRRPLGSAAAF